MIKRVILILLFISFISINVFAKDDNIVINIFTKLLDFIGEPYFEGTRGDYILPDDLIIEDIHPGLWLRSTDDNVAYGLHYHPNVDNYPFGFWRGIDTGTGVGVSPNVPYWYVDNNLDLRFGGDYGTQVGFWNGSFLETFNALVTSDGATVTMTLTNAEDSAQGLTMVFSDGYTDLAASQTIALTAGSDTSPTDNFIYIPRSTKVLTKSTSAFPTTEEHIKVSYFLVPSAGFVQTNGTYINQNWNDHASGTDNQGHMLHIAERSRRDGAYYFSGIDGNGTDGYLTPTASNVELKATAGVIYQMHRHTVPAFDTSGTDQVLVKNWSGDAYHDITNLFDITADSTGAAIANNKYFNLTLWAVGNKSGEYTPMMINLPSGSYNTQSAAENDTSGYNDDTMPRQYDLDSSTGFLIARITIQMGTTWTVISTKDLRNQKGTGSGAGTGATVNEFFDNVWRVQDETDPTKEMAFDVGAKVSTSTTRTITVPNRNLDLADPTFDSVTIGNDEIFTFGAATLRYDSTRTDILFDNDILLEDIHPSMWLITKDTGYLSEGGAWGLHYHPGTEYPIGLWRGTEDGTGVQVSPNKPAWWVEDDITPIVNFPYGIGALGGDIKKRIYISASAGLPPTTTGCADAAQAELGTTDINRINLMTCDFDASSDEYWIAHMTMPENYDGGTFTAAVSWTCTADGSKGVAWFIQLLGMSDGDVMGATDFGTAIEMNDDGQTTNDYLLTAESAAITENHAGGSGTMVGGDELWIKIYRDVSDADDDLTTDGKFIGVWLTFGIDALSTED